MRHDGRSSSVQAQRLRHRFGGGGVVDRTQQIAEAVDDVAAVHDALFVRRAQTRLVIARALGHLPHPPRDHRKTFIGSDRLHPPQQPQQCFGHRRRDVGLVEQVRGMLHGKALQLDAGGKHAGVDEAGVAVGRLSFERRPPRKVLSEHCCIAVDDAGRRGQCRRSLRQQQRCGAKDVADVGQQRGEPEHKRIVAVVVGGNVRHCARG
jgi:hypothetical protein